MSVRVFEGRLVQAQPAQLAAWKVRDSTSDLYLAGACPVCGDECLADIRSRVFLGGAPANVVSSVIESIPRLVVCNCEVAHPGRPDTVLAGCGASWMVLVEKAPGGVWEVKPFNDSGLLPALKALSGAEQMQNERIHRAAEKWTTGVTALIGLFSIAGLITAKDAVAGLALTSRSILAAVMLAALLCAVIAVVRAYMAAFGLPRDLPSGSVEDVKAVYASIRDEPRLAAQWLRTAVRAAVAAVLLLALAMFLMWFFPRDAPAAVSPPTGVPSSTATVPK